MKNTWPAIPYRDWAPTCSALHLWLQIAGKYRLSHAPWLNHSWHATFYVIPRGLTTGPVPDGARSVSLTFDFIEHCLVAEADDGARHTTPLEAMSVADFLQRCAATVRAVGGTFAIHGHPNEIPDALAFAEDHARRPYDATAVRRYHQALVGVDAVFRQFRSAFIGKVSPVHLFWGSMDLAVTRFSGRRAPLHPGGVPALPDRVAREAYSHEVSSAGFWPGGMGVDAPMFYSYAYPTPDGFADWPVEPAEASFDEDLGEFLLAYDAVRASDDPEAMLLKFLKSTYEAAAELSGWPRKDLECAPGRPGIPRPLNAASDLAAPR